MSWDVDRWSLHTSTSPPRGRNRNGSVLRHPTAPLSAPTSAPGWLGTTTDGTKDAWIWFGTKPIALILIFLAWPSQSSAQDQCCKKMILSYPSGDAIPPECSKNVKCTEAPVMIEDTDSQATAVGNFLSSATKIGTLSVINNKDKMMALSQVTALIHKGPGPAVFLDNAKLEDNSFKKLKTLTVENLQPYCNGAKLIDIQGPLDATVKKRLDKILNETLAPCKSLKDTGSSGGSASSSSPCSSSSAGQNNHLITCPSCPSCSQMLVDADFNACSPIKKYMAIGVIIALFVLLVAMAFYAFIMRVPNSWQQAAARQEPSSMNEKPTEPFSRTAAGLEHVAEPIGPIWDQQFLVALVRLVTLTVSETPDPGVRDLLVLTRILSNSDRTPTDLMISRVDRRALNSWE
ncbi:unnamed protein product [Caenorhabditis auriculariae]|uniref:Uncharacterized protein n=1 Tax=Caenorhabditis auriculariae TaxID=2777116 RepID=A0A8S1HNA3_9PELO|nr:unnamed protein product [Caenorhabditis auriculariae]